MLSFLFILIQLNIYFVYGGDYCNYRSFLPKDGMVTISYGYRYMKNFIYVDASEFSGDSIKFKLTLFDGIFKEKVMYYGGFDNEPNGSSVYLSEYKKFFGTDSQEIYSLFYDHVSYYYEIPKPTEKYLYVSVPIFEGNVDSRVEVEISNLNIGLIVGLISGGVFLFSIIIFVFIFFRTRRADNERNQVHNPQTNKSYTPMVTTSIESPPSITTETTPAQPIIYTP